MVNQEPVNNGADGPGVTVGETDSDDREIPLLESVTAPPSPGQESISKLNERVAELEDKIKEMRFWGVLGAVLSFDCWFFLKLNNTAGILCIFSLQVVGLWIFAKRCQVEEVGEITDKVLGLWRNRFGASK